MTLHQTGNGKSDFTFDQNYAAQLYTQCPRSSGDQNLFVLDFVTPVKSDNYYKNLLASMVLLSSDKKVALSPVLTFCARHNLELLFAALNSTASVKAKISPGNAIGVCLLPETPTNCTMASSSMEVDNVLSEHKVLPPKPKFESLKHHEMPGAQVQFHKVSVPPHRYTPLKKVWMDIYTPVYEQMKIDIRMNLKGRKVELKTRHDTPDISNLQKCADFVHAFVLGFDVIDAIAILRLDELYVEYFEIKDVKTLRGDHLLRAIGRLSGKGGKAKFTIENASKARIVEKVISLLPNYGITSRKGLFQVESRYF